MTRVEGCVLVVDDDEGIREVVQSLLEDEGCAVRTATDGRAALAALEEFLPDVILLDMRMPVMDGWQFAAAYRERPEPKAPVVVMTAAQNASAWAKEIQADAFVPKPFEVDALFRILRRFTTCIQP